MKVFARISSKWEYDWFVKSYPGTYHVKWVNFEIKLQRDRCVDIGFESEIKMGSWNKSDGWYSRNGYTRVYPLEFYLNQIE